MKQKGFTPILVLILIALAVVGYFGYKNYWPKLKTLITPTPTATADPTANWKTYTNSKAGYLIKYPSDWFASDNAISNVKSPLPERGVFTIVFYPTDTSISNLDALLSSILKNFKSSEGDPPFTTYESKSNTTVAGYNALKVTGSGYGGKFISYLVVNPIAKTNAHISVVYQEGDLKKFQSIVDQILSTFKFIDQSNAEGKFCGGIAANLPENQCPDGFYCKLDGKYPDAGGVCIKN